MSISEEKIAPKVEKFDSFKKIEKKNVDAANSTINNSFRAESGSSFFGDAARSLSFRSNILVRIFIISV